MNQQEIKRLNRQHSFAYLESRHLFELEWRRQGHRKEGITQLSNASLSYIFRRINLLKRNKVQKLK